MAWIVKSVDVDAPISAVYDQWTQFESFPQFMGGVDQITQSDDTHTHWVTSVGGVSREFDTEVTDQHPDERVAWKSTDGTTHAGVITFHRLGETSTTVAAQIARQPDGIEKAGAVLGSTTAGSSRTWSGSRTSSSAAAARLAPGAATCRPDHEPRPSGLHVNW
jgi:uncharacterized membrane protein